MIFEAQIAGGVALYDVSQEMPRHARRRYQKRRQPIERRYVHHSGALGRPGLEGALASTRYLVRARNFPGAAYHFWVPYEPVRDDDGALVLFRLQPDDVRSWHTGGAANGHGIALALQGNLNTRPLSESQIEILEAWIPWSGERYGGGLAWHSIAGQFGGRSKPACPGKHAEAWLRAYVENA